MGASRPRIGFFPRGRGSPVSEVLGCPVGS